MNRKYIKHLLIITLAAFATVVICEFKGDDWEGKVRTTLYKISNDSVPVYSSESVDEKGIPYVNYYELNGVTAGKQYNPTIVCNYALNYYKQLKPGVEDASTIKFFNCVDWLSGNMTYNDNYALYQFNWQQPWYDSVGVPYTSGMTSGLAIQAFTDAYRLTKSPEYLQNAKALVRGYFIPIQKGGFTYKDPDGWWYEELADTALHTPKILDGHIFAITGVYEFWLETKDDSAAIIINKGIEALKNRLNSYNIGNGWALYDKYQKPADKKYQRILVSQMQQLYAMTGDKLFKEYYSQWNAPLAQPYIIRIFKEGNRSGIVLFILVYVVVGAILLGGCSFNRKFGMNRLPL